MEQKHEGGRDVALISTVTLDSAGCSPAHRALLLQEPLTNTSGTSNVVHTGPVGS